jgi:glycosyltransferase involved in cell wall biosynthesis
VASAAPPRDCSRPCSPAQEGLYWSGGAVRSVTDAVTEWRPDVVVVQMLRCGWAADEIHRARPDLPVIFDAIDCMSLHYERVAAMLPTALGVAHRMEAARCRSRETQLVDLASVATAVSRRDLEALDAGAKGRVVPVAASAPIRLDDPPSGPPTVILSGNLGYRPTVRAAVWFAVSVWPQIRRRVPSARWVLAGARPAPEIRRLAMRPGIEVHGDVDDLASFLQRARVAIAPMSSGSGVPLKILEALAAGVPVVADPWSAAGLEDATAVAVADGRAEWIETVSALLEDPARARQQSSRAYGSWRAHYQPDAVALAIRRAVDAATSRAID